MSLGSKGEDGGGPTSVHGVGATAEGAKHVTFSVPQLEQAHACEPESLVPGVSVNGAPGAEDLPKDLNPSWVECVNDKRSWAELLEEQSMPSPVCVNAAGGAQGAIDEEEATVRSLKKQGEQFDRNRYVTQVDQVDRNRYDICEVFSPPRVCTTAREHGLRGGWPIDIGARDPGTGRCYDLRNPKEQKDIKRMIKRDQPTVLIVSPPCTAFSIANQGEVGPHMLAGAVEMIRFSIELCKLQHRAGRNFNF